MKIFLRDAQQSVGKPELQAEMGAAANDSLMICFGNIIQIDSVMPRWLRVLSVNCQLIYSSTATLRRSV